MKRPNWLIGAVIVIGLIALAQAGILFKLKVSNTATAKKVERLADNVAELMHVRTIQPKKSALEGIDTRLRELERELNATKRQLASFSSADVDDRELGEIIDRKLGEKLMTAMSAFRGRLNPRRPFEAIVEELKLNAEQKQVFLSTLEKSRGAVRQLTAQANANDAPFLQELRATLVEPLSREQKIEKIRKLLSERTTPGRSETYFEALERIRDRAFDELSYTLTEEQLEQLRGMNLNPFAIHLAPPPPP